VALVHLLHHCSLSLVENFGLFFEGEFRKVLSGKISIFKTEMGLARRRGPAHRVELDLEAPDHRGTAGVVGGLQTMAMVKNKLTFSCREKTDNRRQPLEVKINERKSSTS
jgi:hypothetical protein